MKLKILTILIAVLTYSANASAFFDWSDEEALTVSKEFEGNYSGRVSMDYEFVEDDILKISVAADDMVVPVLGLAFHLKYPSLNLKFLKYGSGDFLENGGDPFYLVQDDQAYAAVVFGETLRRTDSFPTGKGKIADFYFQIVDGEKYEFYFDKGVVSTLDTVRQDIDRIEWIGIEAKKSESKKSVEMKESLKSQVLNLGVGKLLFILTSLITVFAIVLYVYRLKRLNKRFG